MVQGRQEPTYRHAQIVHFVRSAALLDWTSAAKEASLAAIGEGLGMDDDYRELTNHLFAVATAMLEDAIEVAAAGQSSRLGPSQLADHSRRLQTAAHDIAVIAEAAAIVANLGVNQPENQRKTQG